MISLNRMFCEIIFKTKNFYKGIKSDFEDENKNIPGNINKITDYLLISIENNHHGKGRINLNHYNKEHICPQTIEGTEWEYLFSPEDHHDYVHTLGNITLLAKEYNSSNGNNSFESKKNNPNGFKDDKLYLNQFINDCNDWTVDNIKRRTDLMATKFKSNVL